MVAKVIFFTLIITLSSFSKATNFITTSFITTSEPVWAFGDTHGAYDELIKTLKQAKLINEELNWTGGKAHLVTTGDVLDRGPHPRKILDLMIKLEQQAAQAGGAFHFVLGNHEVMILVGDLRYVAKEEYLEFAADETPQIRENYFNQYVAYQNLFNQKLETKEITDTNQLKTKFDREHPHGFFARYEAFSPQGKYGSWLLKKPVILKVNDNLFAHGGLSSELTGKQLDALNQTLKNNLNDYLSNWHQLIKSNQLPIASKFKKRHLVLNSDNQKALDLLKNYPKDFIFNTNSPTWYRGASYCHPYYETDSVTQQLKQFSANQLFVGHSVTQSRKVETRLDKKVTTMDTGMLAKVYRGKGNLVKIFNNEVTVLDSDGNQYIAQEATHQAIKYPRKFSEKDIEKILKKGKITLVEKLNMGITEPLRVTIESGNIKVRAVFKNIDTNPKLEKRRKRSKSSHLPDRYHFDIAAYRLSKYMGFNMVPVSVERRINRAKGVVQYWVEDSYSKYTADEKGWEYQGYCSYDKQRNMMRVFDLLIHNTDRNASNILIEQEREQLVWIDHSRAFAQREKLPDQINTADLHITPKVKQALERLNRKELTKLMDGLLNRFQVKAILKRRDLILALETNKDK